MDRLDASDIDVALAALPGWTREGACLTRRYRFGSYREVIAFVNRVAELAEKQNHHPDLLVKWGEVAVSYTTHDAGGITRADVEAARAVESIAG